MSEVITNQPIYFPPAKRADLMNPLVLAYMGDAVYETFIRQYVVSQPNHRPNHLHREATKFVSAKAQARALDRMLPLLTEEEVDIMKRGRNAKSGSSPKNTDILVYRHSTAFECLLGYLYYQQRFDRLDELMRFTLEK
ncbi:ribonuclease III [Paenibacillus swuensis]|uniref:Mini-ribonuclease 3 n=1 Tax=Paenibacillus swuensis TaxID=1178515 RepID=A0A172TIN6_9BACL|nr:Mini-ribonuclease 3 [Paenibacillus swuensis]ANE46764.1 ribonuclease III [Paenibacillus swuensis]